MVFPSSLVKLFNLKNNPKILTLDIKLRSCVVGEYRKINSCENCSSGETSYENQSYVCHKCDQNMVCENGTIIKVSNSSWRGQIN